MPTVFDFFVLAVLLFIAAELYVISRELFRLSRSLPARMEPKEGQTINVNLGQLPAAAPSAEGAAAERPEPPPAAIPEPETAAIAEPEPEPEPPPPPPPPPRPSAGARPTTSGLVALKCPKCQAENSSYRSECFNCGQKL